MMPKKTTVSKDQDQNIEQLKEQINTITRELLTERITRIDFQVQLLAQWRQGCQQKLNHLLGREESFQSPEDSHG
jgi:hypothetical protein